MSLTQDLASSASDQSLSFSYNRSGQALTRTGSNAAYVWPQPSPSTTNATANGLNQLATLNGAGVSHDGRGNLTAAGAAAYGYDIFNRLTSAGTATLGYDPAGRLYETAGGGVTTRFLYDGADMILKGLKWKQLLDCDVESIKQQHCVALQLASHMRRALAAFEQYSQNA